MCYNALEDKYMKQKDSKKQKFNKEFKVNHSFYLLLSLLPIILLIVCIILANTTKMENLFYCIAGLFSGMLASIMVAWLIEISNIRYLKNFHDYSENTLLYNMVFLASVTFWGFSLVDEDEEVKDQEHTWKEWIELNKKKKVDFSDENDAKDFMRKSTRLEIIYKLTLPLINMYKDIVNNRLYYLEKGYITNEDYISLAYDTIDYDSLEQKFKSMNCKVVNSATTSMINKLEYIVKFLNTKGFKVNKFKHSCGQDKIFSKMNIKQEENYENL